MGQKSSRTGGSSTGNDEKVANLIVRLRSSTTTAISKRKRKSSKNKPHARRYSSRNEIATRNGIDMINDTATSSFYSPNFVCIRYIESLLIAYGYLRRWNINPTDIATILARYISHSRLTMSIQTYNSNMNANYHLFRMIFFDV